tara:strand:+ start:9162 stop:9935 length:774 start_codon:yes stop_codon:yes gene_type:complete
MPIKLSNYQLIIFDGFGTLYDKDLLPLPGAIDLLNKIGNQSILFSNVGSITGDELRERLAKNFNRLPSRIITSLDILLRYLKKNDINEIYHYGGLKTAELLTKSNISVVPFEKESDIIVFTSLPSENWIKDSQSVLKLINDNKVKQVILANPDRLLPGEHVGINIGMMFDVLINNWPINKRNTFNVLELGKPMLTKSDMDIKDGEKILIIGDNNITDGGLAKNLNCDFSLISKDNIDEKDQRINVFKSLADLMNNEK